MGNIKPDSIVDLKFVLKNTGANKLFIGDFTTTCGCTKVLASKLEILQNDTFTIFGTIDTKGKIGNSVSVIMFKTNTIRKYPRLILKYFITP